jgi:hypothetical protein
MFLTRIAWTCWALVPVGVLAYHYGPGQRSYAYDQAARLQARAARAERSAAAAQETAYAAHLAGIEARRAAFISQSPDAAASARVAAAAEDQAYHDAAIEWKKTADAFGQIESVLQGASPQSLARIRWARSRALIRAGEIGRGADDLEDLLEEFAARGESESDIARSTREELATAYYYGARLMRLAGKSAEDWRAISSKARQQFRYLTEQSRTKGAPEETTMNYQRNLELVLNLEQSSLQELQGRPMPRQSPREGANGLRPGNRPGKSQRPPRKRDSRGAGGAGDIGPGW